MAQNTPQGRSGCHSCAAFGPPGTKCGHKGLPNLEWIGSIGSVFGSSVPPNASCVSQNAQRESKWLKMAQNRPQMAQSRVKMAQSGSKWPKMAQNGLNRPQMAQMAE